MAALTQATASYVSDETVSVFAFDEFIQTEPVMPALFNQKPSSAYREVMGSTAALSDFVEKTELAAPDEDTPIQQFKKEYLHTEYALQSKVERKVIDDALFPFFEEFGTKIGDSAMRTVEKDAANVFINAFDTTLTEDGLSLCNNAHLNVDSGNSQDNLGTSSLDFAAVGTTRQLMRDFTDYRANRINVNPDMLLVPVELEQTAWEIIRSSGDPTSANNAANFHQGRYSLVVWGYLTSSVDWFMIDSRMMKQHLFWFWRMVLEIFGDGELMKGLRSIGGYYRSSRGPRDWRWVFGHNV